MLMKQAMRDHYYAYGRTRGFLTIHALLSKGLKGPVEPSGLDLYCYDFCGCSTDSFPCEHYQLFLAGWKEGAAQAEQVYMRQDLDLVEDLGRAAGFTSKRPLAIILGSRPSAMERKPNCTAKCSDDLSEDDARPV